MSTKVKIAVTIILAVVLFFAVLKIAASTTIDKIQNEIDVITVQVDTNSQEIERLNIIKSELHNLANLLRVDPKGNQDFINSLSDKWTCEDEKIKTLTAENDKLQNQLNGLYQKIEEEISRRANINQDDLDLLARVIYSEATENKDIRVLDRQLVGTVVMNRVASPSFPNTLQGVVYQGNGIQYACIKSSKFRQKPPQECYDIATELLLGERYAPSNVVYQASFKQGSGVYMKVGIHYYCYQ